MSETVDKKIVNGYTVTVTYDEFPLDPMRDGDTLGVMLADHRNYTLGSDKNLTADYEPIMNHFTGGFGDRKGIEVFARWMKIYGGATVVLPLTLYDHSGITMYAGSGSGWDTTLVGVIFDTPERRQTCGVTDPDKIEQLLREEVKIYASYLEGMVYAYTVTNDEDEVVWQDGSIFDSQEALAAGTEEAERLLPITELDTLRKRETRLITALKHVQSKIKQQEEEEGESDDD